MSAKYLTLREKCPYSDFSGPHFPAFGPEKLRIRTVFTQCKYTSFVHSLGYLNIV